MPRKKLFIFCLFLLIFASSIVFADSGIGFVCNKEFNVQLRQGAVYRGYLFYNPIPSINIYVPFNFGLVHVDPVEAFINQNRIPLSLSYLKLPTGNGIPNIWIKYVKYYDGGAVLRIKTECNS